MKRILIMLVLLLFVSGCSYIPKVVEFDVKEDSCIVYNPNEPFVGVFENIPKEDCKLGGYETQEVDYFKLKNRANIIVVK